MFVVQVSAAERREASRLVHRSSEGSHGRDEVVDLRAVSRSLRSVDVDESAVDPEDEVAAQLKGVLGGEADTPASSHQPPVPLQGAQPPDPRPGASPEAVRPIHAAILVSEYRVREAEAAPKARKVARTRERDQHHNGIAELGEPVAHGDRVRVAWQSGQMTVKDQDDGPPAVLRQPPPVTRIAGKVDLGGDVALVNSHVKSFPRNASFLVLGGVSRIGGTVGLTLDATARGYPERQNPNPRRRHSRWGSRPRRVGQDR
jgi:hypothetical protein